MKLEAIYHRTGQNWCYMYSPTKVHVTIRTGRGDIESVELCAGDKYDLDNTMRDIPMRVVLQDGLFDYWEVEAEAENQRFQYFFRLQKGTKVLYFNENGFAKERPGTVIGLFDLPYLHDSDRLQPPEWTKHAVFYQIFPERFANGDSSNDPAGTLPWGGKPEQQNFFGGDLQGVLEHLDHLAELGINAIYFTPIFPSPTNHKYDTANYKEIDPHFGDKATLKKLVEAAHARGIRVVLDAVFNHSGGRFAPFLDVKEKGANSPYKDWFFVQSFPLQVENGRPTYRTFGFEAHMPKLNTGNPELKQYLLDVARYWIKEFGIDGWRLDVANEVDHQFWREFRQAVKEVNPECYIVGEVWHHSMRWLQGDQFDSVMNYPFTTAVLDFFAKQTIDAEQFAHRISGQLAAYPRQATEAMFNVLDSHDTPRLLTIAGGDKRKMKLAALFQLAFPGAPCIYYGDEIGMDGEGDPDCRKCMEWDPAKQDRELFDFYRGAIALRKRCEALRTGSFRFIAADAGSGAVVFERAGKQERAVIALNGSSRSIEIAAPYEEGKLQWALAAEGTREKNGKIALEPHGYAVWTFPGEGAAAIACD